MSIKSTDYSGTVTFSTRHLRSSHADRTLLTTRRNRKHLTITVRPLVQHALLRLRRYQSFTYTSLIKLVLTVTLVLGYATTVPR